MGRPAAIKFVKYPKQQNMTRKADKAGMHGVYSVESMKNGIWYFCADRAIVISTIDGFVWMKEETAETVANELLGILEDVKKFRSVGIRWAQGDPQDE